jgi:hypothetical protein
MGNHDNLANFRRVFLDVGGRYRRLVQSIAFGSMAQSWIRLTRLEKPTSSAMDVQPASSVLFRRKSPNLSAFTRRNLVSTAPAAILIKTAVRSMLPIRQFTPMAVIISRTINQNGEIVPVHSRACRLAHGFDLVTCGHQQHIMIATLNH